MTNISRRRIPRNSKSLETEIICSDNRPRIEPGEYSAISRAAKRYFDKAFSRWVVMVSFDILSESLFEVIAKRVPLFFNLGNGEHPKPSRRGLFHHAWFTANGAPPSRSGRMPLNVFINRVARVLVRDTHRSIQDEKRAVAPYSVIDEVLEWKTGDSGAHLINESTNQGRHGSRSARTGTCRESTPTTTPFGLPNERTQASTPAGVGHHNTTQGDGRENTSAVQRHHAAPARSEVTNLSAAHGSVLEYETATTDLVAVLRQFAKRIVKEQGSDSAHAREQLWIVNNTAKDILVAKFKKLFPEPQPRSKG